MMSSRDDVLLMLTIEYPSPLPMTLSSMSLPPSPSLGTRGFGVPGLPSGGCARGRARGRARGCVRASRKARRGRGGGGGGENAGRRAGRTRDGGGGPGWGNGGVASKRGCGEQCLLSAIGRVAPARIQRRQSRQNENAVEQADGRSSGGWEGQQSVASTADGVVRGGGVRVRKVRVREPGCQCLCASRRPRRARNSCAGAPRRQGRSPPRLSLGFRRFK